MTSWDALSRCIDSLYPSKDALRPLGRQICSSVIKTYSHLGASGASYYAAVALGAGCHLRSAGRRHAGISGCDSVTALNALVLTLVVSKQSRYGKSSFSE